MTRAGAPGLAGALAVIAACALAACQRGADDPSAESPSAVAALADKGEAGAKAVLTAWARDLETGDYDAAYALWLDGSRSGKSEAEHAVWWDRFKTITVSAGEGEVEGAAGSLFYAAPVTVVGKQQDGHPYRLEGTVTLRRVNDVDGATPAQLRWHIDNVELKPAN